MMLKDHNHDLVDSLSKKNDSVWRYKHHYQKAAKGCKHCTALWKQLAEDDNKHIALLVAEIERHMKEKRFN